MKHMTRKPALPLLLLGLLVFGVIFMTLFQKGIADDEIQVEALYNNTRITCQVVLDESGSSIRLAPTNGERIAAVEGVAETYGRRWCSFQLLDMGEYVEGSVYGSENLDFLCQDNNIALEYFEGYDKGTFESYDPYCVPCIVEKTLFSEFGLAPGQELHISPMGGGDSAPVITLYVAGTFSDPLGNLPLAKLLVPDKLFLSDVTIPQLLYNTNMMYYCMYERFSFRIDPSYNRELSSVLERVQEVLPRTSEYTVIADSKALALAILPLERKIAIQKLLILPLAVLFCAAAAVVALLLTLSWKREIFLRLMWGEKRSRVLFKLLGGLLLLLLLSSVLAALGVWTLAGGAWMESALGYLALMLALCLLLSLLPLSKFTLTNLVELYQAGEG